ncbi:MAG: 3-deoxy-manno-octulosonate cytidylyltransferase [Opitutales bacterium]|jgi:3-deoxy-manno-octulosonate cytidylyltransferase (CMP-KDO synthetase)|nr:3-deoxy-manno-octulosonate cytidylyltransferase [Opitutales bacterium]MDP4644013.1 3-deoxy-manno-octulosonate cytidylyltransferase [Opitutales bacterium]MDP4777039.1 3-deoxy-manno-octulosonate cytidylyltransferase [Opitutales bacterium]MDP4882665.1 3-deoxy-manno-octulosonate cytidylyltransferase [Opitutales bacterium]MDP5080962.1 3-deoxy-manno-octulosonate cytidylyltransferase [Opitutales bacterium]
MKKVAAIIPARKASSRFPNKPLAHILGKPMILWVVDLTANAVGIENTYVATDCDEIASIVLEAGFQVVMTSSDALTGTDRIAEAARQIDAEIFINVQGDEPMLDPASIAKVIEYSKLFPGDVINGFARIGASENPADVNIPKCVIAADGRLLYMSRAAVPSFKDPLKCPQVYHKQVCIYAFSSEQLDAYSSATAKAPCEEPEDIEILRFLDMGYTVRMIELPGDTLAVDVPEDIQRVEEAMRAAGYSS